MTDLSQDIYILIKLIKTLNIKILKNLLIGIFSIKSFASKIFITKKDGEIGVDKIIKFEDLSNDFEDTIKILGIKFTDNNLKKLNFTDNLGYRKYYDNNTRYKVEKFCFEDLEYFNYKF